MCAEESMARVQKVTRVLKEMKADDVRAEQTLDELIPVGEGEEDGRGREC